MNNQECSYEGQFLRDSDGQVSLMIEIKCKYSNYNKLKMCI